MQRLCTGLLDGDNALVVMEQAASPTAEVARELLPGQDVRADFALLFERDELLLCDLRLRGALGGGGVALVVAELTRRAGSRTELQRACLEGLNAPSVLDPFAGWGMDAFALVGAGARVDCVEQQPALVALLRDAQRRVTARFAEHLNVRRGDAFGVLSEMASGVCDVIYLDPMFVPRKKGALPNKRLQYLAQLCESRPPGDAELAALVELACTKAGRQVVLKRRKRDGALTGCVPLRQVVGASVRYDIFAPH